MKYKTPYIIPSPTTNIPKYLWVLNINLYKSYLNCGTLHTTVLHILHHFLFKSAILLKSAPGLFQEPSTAGLGFSLDAVITLHLSLTCIRSGLSLIDTPSIEKFWWKDSFALFSSEHFQFCNCFSGRFLRYREEWQLTPTDCSMNYTSFLHKFLSSVFQMETA